MRGFWKVMLSWLCLVSVKGAENAIPHPEWDPSALVFDDGVIRVTFPVSLKHMVIESLFEAHKSDDSRALGLSTGPWDDGIQLSGHLFDYIGAGFLSSSRYRNFESPLGPCPARIVSIPFMGRKCFVAVPFARRDRVDISWKLAGNADKSGEELAMILKDARRVGPGDPARLATAEAREVVFAGFGFMLPWQISMLTDDFVVSERAEGRTSKFSVQREPSGTLEEWLSQSDVPQPPAGSALEERDCQVAGVAARESGYGFSSTQAGKPVFTSIRRLVSTAKDSPFEVRCVIQSEGGSATLPVEAESTWRTLVSSISLHPDRKLAH